jgi:hypothetical protein
MKIYERILFRCIKDIPRVFFEKKKGHTTSNQEKYPSYLCHATRCITKPLKLLFVTFIGRFCKDHLT